MLALPVLLVAQLRFSSSSSLLFVGCASVSGALSHTTRTRPSSRTARVLTCIRAAAYSDFATGCCKHRSSCCSTSRGTPPPRNWKVSVHRARVCDLRWGLGLGPGLCFTSCGHAGRVLPPGRGDRCGAESWGLRHCSARRGSGVYRENFGVKGGITFGASSGKMTSVASREGGRQLRQRKETHMSLSTQAIGRKKTKGVTREATSTDDEMELRQGIEESAAATEFEARLWDLDKSNKLTTLTVLELRGYMKLMSKPTAGRKDELISTVKEWLANRETSTLKQGPAIQETSSDAESLEGALLKAESKNREAKAEAVSRRMDIPPKKGNQKKKDAAVPETKAALKDAAESAALKRKSGDAQMSAKGKLSKADPEGDGSLEEENTVKVATKKKSQSLNAVKSNDVGSVTPSEDQGKKRKLEQVAKDLQEETNLQVVEEKVVEINVDPKKPWLTLTHKKPKADWVPYDPDTMRPAALPSSVKSMKLLSWNVNGLRALLKEKDKKVQEGLLLMQLAKEEDFDVLCLQETKLQSRDVDQITATLLPEYTHGYWSCSTAKLGYSGTAIISRVKPLSMTYGIGVPDHDNEGRLITVEFDAFYLVTSYVPNSGDKLVRLAYRTEEWDPALSQYLKELEKKKPVILTGDLNCSNDEIDISNPDGNRKSAGFTNEERESFKTNFLNKGLVDTFRQQHPNAVGYTYWGYRTQARSKNNGWRLDYFLVSEGLVNQIHDSYIRPDVMGSDHCPIGLIVKV